MTCQFGNRTDFGRAHIKTRPTLDAELLIDDMHLLAFAFDGIHGTVLLA
jgi:hypothetical protein